MLLEKNFIASQVSLRLVSYTFDVDDASVETGTGKNYIPAGSIISVTDGQNNTTVKGVALDDVYFKTGEEKAIGSLIVAGHLFSDRLPVAPTADEVKALAAMGLYFEVAPTTVVPADGTIIEE